MRKEFIVKLTSKKRQILRNLVSSGKASARKLTHARILLKADRGPGGSGWNDKKIAGALDVGRATVERVRKRFVQDGLEGALDRRKGCRIYQRKLDRDAEAHLIALTCSQPPKGHARWTLRLLADRMVRLEYVDTVSYRTVGRILKKTNLSLG